MVVPNTFPFEGEIMMGQISFNLGNLHGKNKFQGPYKTFGLGGG